MYQLHFLQFESFSSSWFKLACIYMYEKESFIFDKNDNGLKQYTLNIGLKNAAQCETELSVFARSDQQVCQVSVVL